MMTSQEARHHFLVFFSSVEDDEKPFGSSSSLGFFPQVQKMMTSYEALDSLTFLGFFLKCELIGCITT
jgi:hypothetical protein